MPVLDTIRLLANFGEFYWSDGGERDRDAFIGLADADWKDALGAFLRDFAYERQGASRDFPVAAVQALEAQAQAQPDAGLAGRVWPDFLARQGLAADERGANPLRQPIRPADAATLSVFDLVAQLGDDDFNIMRWARNRLAAGDAAHAFRQLQRVRGIGDKIAAFYLRDVLDGFGLNDDVEPATAVQPIDVWTRRGAKALAPLLGLATPTTNAHAAAVLVEGAHRAEVRSTLVNAGLWVFAAQFLGSNLTFAEALGDDQAMAAALEGAEVRAAEDARRAHARFEHVHAIRLAHD